MPPRGIVSPICTCIDGLNGLFYFNIVIFAPRR